MSLWAALYRTTFFSTAAPPVLRNFGLPLAVFLFVISRLFGLWIAVQKL